MIITVDQVVVFFLVFARLGAMMIYAPIFKTKELLSMGKLVLLFWISLLVIFYIPLPTTLPNSPITLILSLLVEVLIGALIGFAAEIFIIGIELAGALMDTQAGLSVASLLDPATGQSTTLLSKLMKQIALLLFLILDGHHILLGFMINSFRAVPVAYPVNLQFAIEHVVNSSMKIFSIGLQFASPIIFVVFIIDFAFGMLSRVAPQINVFQLGFQVKPLISLFVLLLILPGMVDFMYILFEDISKDLLRLLFLFRV